MKTECAAKKSANHQHTMPPCLKPTQQHNRVSAMNTTRHQQARAQPANSAQYLSFMLGEEEYGINILKVQEIRGWTTATEIPNSPDYVLGVVNLRGIVIPVIDLRIKFSLSQAQFAASTVVVIVNVTQQDETRTVGMVVDAVSDVYDVSADNVQQAPSLGNLIATDYITGLASVNEKMLILLDVDKLINVGVLQLAAANVSA
jgi:purine-binding chemotaxis protein CheW